MFPLGFAGLEVYEEPGFVSTYFVYIYRERERGREKRLTIADTYRHTGPSIHQGQTGAEGPAAGQMASTSGWIDIRWRWMLERDNNGDDTLLSGSNSSNVLVCLRKKLEYN